MRQLIYSKHQFFFAFHLLHPKLKMHEIIDIVVRDVVDYVYRSEAVGSQFITPGSDVVSQGNSDIKVDIDLKVKIV